MYDNIKEIYVGVVLGVDKEGNEVSKPIYLGGRPVPTGVYTPKELPPGSWTWAKLCAKAIRHNGHSIDVVYHGDEWPKPKKKEVKEVKE